MSLAQYPLTGDTRKIIGSARRLIPELVRFGGIGAVALVVDVGLYNLLRLGPMADEVILPKIISVIVATTVAWIGNRFLTYRDRRGSGLMREAVLFFGSNAVALLIATGCLYVSHYVLGFTSQAADNIAGNVVGVALGTMFRFIAYRTLVFKTGAVTV